MTLGVEAGTRARRVVVVDDDPLVLAVTRRVLSRRGYEAVCCDHARLALCEVLREKPFAVVADLHMPDLNGTAFLRLVRGIAPESLRILFTGESYPLKEVRALSASAIDSVVTKADGHLQLPAALEQRRTRPREEPCEARALALALASALTVPKVETLDHVLRLSYGALKLGALAGLDDASLWALELGALLHDVGMVSVPESLVSCARPLEAHEWDVIRGHPSCGASIVQSSPQLACALPVVLHHHERYDGQGYPHGLSGDQIPLSARILAVLDTFEALTHDRPHVLSRGESEARASIARLSGTQLDPYAVELFMAVSPEEWRRPLGPSRLGAEL